MFQIGTKERQYVIDYRNVNIDLLLPLLSDPSKEIVGQNLKFEYKHILHNNKVRLATIYDTKIAEELLYKGYDLPNGLGDLIPRYLGIKVNKDTRLEFLSIGKKPFTDVQIEYGADDILYPLYIRDKQLEKCKKENMENLFKLEMNFVKVLGEIEYKGLYFDKKRWKNLFNKNLLEFGKLKKKLDEFVIKYYFNSKFISKQFDMFSEEFKCKIQ